MRIMNLLPKNFKFILASVLFSLISLFSYSQGYIKPGAEWNFRTPISGGGYTEFRRWKYENDTIVNNHNYQKISQLIKNVFGGNGPIPVIWLTPFLFRSSGDSLLIAEIDGTNEYLLYDFTPIIGNTWIANPFLHGFETDPTTIQLIETVDFGDTLINDITVNWIDVISQNPDSVEFSGRIYNHFGKNQIFPFWKDGTLDIVPLVWRCYKDDILGEVGQITCLDIETLGFDEINTNEHRVFALPSNNELFIESSIEVSNLSIEIFDLSGKLILSKAKISSNTVEFNAPSGIYICKLQSKERSYFNRVIW